MKKVFAVLTAVAALGLAGQAQAAPGPWNENPVVDPSITDGSADREFQEARSKWQESGVRNYRITIGRSCFCMGPYRAKFAVRRGKVVRASVRGWWGPRTVPGMFKAVHQAIREKVAVLDARYNPRLGFVRDVWADHMAVVADDEIGYRILRLRRP